jgi:uncharacterized protein (TIGR02145 family)
MRFINLLILLLGQVLYLTAQESIVENVRVSQEGEIVKINYDLKQNAFVTIIILEDGVTKIGFKLNGDHGIVIAGTSKQILLIPENSILICSNCIIRVIANAISLQEDIKESIIGQQIWNVNNLNVSTFRNGDFISEAKTVEEWQKAGDEKRPVWCYYNNDTVNGKKYGKLYNWYAINDPRGLAPIGWHIPSDAEWKILIEYLGGPMIAGKKLKDRLGWEFDKNQFGDNSSGFSALPGGMRMNDGSFVQIEKMGYWWSADVIQSGSLAVSLYYAGSQLTKNARDKNYGLSVRILRD